MTSLEILSVVCSFAVLSCGAVFAVLSVKAVIDDIKDRQARDAYDVLEEMNKE